MAVFKPQCYEIIFIQLHSQETLKEVMQWIQLQKRISPQTIIVVGGIAVTLDCSNIIKYDYIDIASIGEGEITIKELCIAINQNRPLHKVHGIAYKNNGTIIYTKKRPPVEQLDSLPLPDRESFGLDYPQWTILTARGCPYKCKFCSMPQISNNVRYRSIDNVYKEIMHLYDCFKMRKFFIVDDTFTLKKQRVIDLCKKLIGDSRKVEWTCVTRADTLDYEMLSIMKEAGCDTISCGIESANEDIQKIMGKNLKISEIEDVLVYAKKIKIRVRCSFIFGLPGETENHIKNSIDFIKKVKPNEVQIYPYIPYNGTDIMKEPDQYQLKTDSLIIKDKKDLLDPWIETKTLDREKLKEISLCGISELRRMGYLWIPGDIPAIKQKLDYIVMTEFSPIQTLC